MKDTVKYETIYYFQCRVCAYLDSIGVEYTEAEDEIDLIDYIDNKNFLESVKDDLEDKGFTSIEADEIIKKTVEGTYNFDEAVCYKFLAYIYALYNDYDDVEELKNIIEGSEYSDIEDFIDEDFEELVKVRNTIDF